MYRLMRNVHLAIGLASVLMAMVFAVSSLAFIYQKSLPKQMEENERTVQVAAEKAPTPRALAMELMRAEGLAGDLRLAEEKDGKFSLRIVRPGEEALVEYVVATGEATIETKRGGVLEMLKQLHTNHGIWHRYIPSELWSMLSVLASLGLILLGASGIYLWWVLKQDRLFGSLLLGGGLLYCAVALVMRRLA